MVTLLVKEARNLKEKVIGLIGKEKPESLLIKTRFGIHTFGLRSPIDVLILSKSNRIVTIKEKLKPKKVFMWNPMYDLVLELPEGTVKEKKIKINDEIFLKVFL